MTGTKNVFQKHKHILLNYVVCNKAYSDNTSTQNFIHTLTTLQSLILCKKKLQRFFVACTLLSPDQVRFIVWLHPTPLRCCCACDHGRGMMRRKDTLVTAAAVVSL